MKVDQADWIQDSATHGMESVENTPVLLVGSLIAGCLAMSLSGQWLVGAGVAGAGIYLAERRHWKVLDSVDYSIKYGAAPAAIKSEKQLREYADHMGREQTAKQLLQAAKSDIPLNGSQWRFLEDYYGEKLDELLDQPPDDRDIQFFHDVKPIRIKRDNANQGQAENASTTLQDAATGFQGDNSATFVQSVSEPQTLQELFLRLKEECPEFLRLIKPLPIRLVGKQRTGKSTFARKLVLLRSALIQGHTVAWATPHREVDNPVPEKLNPFGTHANGGKNIAAIESVWWAVQEAVNQGTTVNMSIVWDEFGSYDQFQFVDELGNSLRSLLRESNKHGYFPILVAHGDQASFYPGIKGILTTLKDSTIKVETIGEEADAFGTMRPTGEVEVFWLDGTQSRFKVPEWLTVDLLLKFQPATIRPALLDNLKAKSKAQEIPPEIAARLSVDTATAIQQPSPVEQKSEWDEQLEWSIAEIASARSKLEAAGMSDELAEDFRRIAEGEILLPIFQAQRHDLLCVVTESIRKGEIKAANIQANYFRKPWYKALPQGQGRDRQAVRNLFRELAAMGIGQIFGEGDKLSYLLLPNDDRRLSDPQKAEADNEPAPKSYADIREVSLDWLPNLERVLGQIEQLNAAVVAEEAQKILGYPIEGDRLNQLVSLLNQRANVKVI